ncbi:Aminoglycoside phosphotransferase [Crenothrix polyspora]|uniref:Aminoglycoside phosphotransferase n=2 Tax=Crenothrix polyspora TaxID=360316 RepID=A0A1R4HD94_9GAMM|nr:Aminoglycoside phosphotransferase [Crenothrix polyspora]
MIEDLRILAMRDWLENDLLLTILSCVPASSDASFRRYFRVTTPEQQFIVMDAPPAQENVEAFIKVATLLSGSQVNVPTIFQHNITDGFLLLQDFGTQCFLDKLSTDNATALYQTAFDSLITLQTNTVTETAPLPRYDNALLTRELAIFKDWYIDQLLDSKIPDALWQNTQNILITSALEQPSVCVHRDFHSRNLMVTTENCPGVIDFQDAVIGPISYDIVSLLRDCYIAWPEQQVDAWMTLYHQRLVDATLITCTIAQFKRWFDLMGMQRHLKAIGIFSRLHLRDGKSGYLNDIPRTLHYVSRISASYPELSEFSNYLNTQLMFKQGLSA